MNTITASNKTKKIAFLGLSFLSFAFFGFELIVFQIGSLIHGTTDLWASPLRLTIHWICTMILWCLGFFALRRMAKKAGYNLFNNKDKPKALNWIFAGILFIASIVMSYIAWQMRFKPVAEFAGFTRAHGAIGIALFALQYIYYFAESLLI